MLKPFESAWLKVARAKHHIEDLDVILRRFNTEHPHETTIEIDSETGEKIHKYRLLEPPPYNSVSIIVGDAVNNLRASLDHAIYACAVASGRANPIYKTCSFPFAKDADAFGGALKGCTAVPEEIRACLREFKPYEGGNDALCILNRFCNTDKHALITPTLIGMENITVAVVTGVMLQPKRFVKWDHAKNEIELFRTTVETKYNYNVSIEIAFDVPGPTSGYRIVPILNEFVNQVENVLMILQAETRRLFPSAFL